MSFTALVIKCVHSNNYNRTDYLLSTTMISREVPLNVIELGMTLFLFYKGEN